MQNFGAIRRLILASLLAPLVWVLSLQVVAGEFKLTDGRVIKGEPVASTFSNQGLNFKLEDGRYSEKFKWNLFTQDALKALAAIPKAKPFAEVLIEDPVPSADEPPVEVNRPKKDPPKWSEVERPERPRPNVPVLAGIATPIGFVIFLLFIGANVYAGYLIAVFRNRPVNVVCGICAVAPIVGPAVFLSMPRAPDGPSPEEIAAAEAAELAAITEAEEQQVQAEVAQQVEAAAQAAVAIPKTIVFRRGEVTFNRKFVESKFAGFFRLVPAATEKDLFLIVRANRGEFTGRRISKATPTDLTFVAQRGEGSTEEVISYAEIQEICIRHKDAQD